MRILQVHNAYQYYSGEDVVVKAEGEMLRRHGHEVDAWHVRSDGLDSLGPWGRLAVALRSVWSPKTFREALRRFAQRRPDVVHVHNTIPLISPSIYTACHRAGIPVVHTLHNFKIFCPGAFLYRDGAVCEDCLREAVPVSCIRHACYRDSRMQTAVAALGLVINRILGTYRRHVTRYIALSGFASRKFAEAGLPAGRIDIKPNFVGEEIAPGAHEGGYALFAGKLEALKGVPTLLEAWAKLTSPYPLKIVGRGPLEAAVRSASSLGVEYCGSVDREHVMALMRDAAFVVFPSEWYEGFPMVIAEAFAAGTPVVASRLGSMEDIVKDGLSGWLFEAGNAGALADAAGRAVADAAERESRGANARRQYEERYTEDANCCMLMEIYTRARIGDTQTGDS